MNILMVLSQLEVTGAEVYAASITDKLIERGHKVFIVSDTLTKKTKAEYTPVPISKRTFFYRIKNSIFLFRFIKEKNIHIVNAHSRAGAWVSNVACLFAKVPLVVFIHGRQATFLSRRLFHAYGDYTIAVCEKLEQQLLDVFKVSPQRVEVLRNSFEVPKSNGMKISGQKTVTFITRFSGPKGDLAYKLLEFISEKRKQNDEFKNVKFRLIGGQTIPERFKRFQDDFEFTGYSENLPDEINNSSVVIGAGRVAIKSILYNKPLIAVGEACTIGLITKDNLQLALETNFGDMNVNEKEFDFEKIVNDLSAALNISKCDSIVHEKIKHECDANKIVTRLEYIFQSVCVRFYKKEIPVIYYHRVVKDLSEAGKHGIYVTAQRFEDHLRFLKKEGFKTISFEKALEVKKNCVEGKFVIITFDDGYEDNYQYAFPLLKKYGFTAIIFLVAQLDHNAWDRQSGEPLARIMNQSQIKEMQEYGIEFGSHTLTHPDLTKISLEDAKKELVDSKNILEKKLGVEIKTLAYPYGNCSGEIKKITCQAGYKFAFATDKAPLGLHEDIYQIRRTGIFPNTTVQGLARKVKGNYIFKREKKDSHYFQIPPAS